MRSFLVAWALTVYSAIFLIVTAINRDAGVSGAPIYGTVAAVLLIAHIIYSRKEKNEHRR